MADTDLDAGSHPAPGGRRPPAFARSRAGIVLVTVVLSLMWPALKIAAYGSFDAVLGVGPRSPALSAVEADIPDLHRTTDYGHDGQYFYVIARHPFDPRAAKGSVVPLAYRYRRILYPALAAVLAPNGGRWLITVFLLLSLAGVAMGAHALSRMPGGRWWLPLTMAFSPGVIAALGMSLSDAFAAGLGLLAVALSMERRWWPMVAALVAAALTRETMMVVVAGLALAPGMTRQMRAATVAIPGAALGAWSWWSARAAGADAAEGGSQQMALPFQGWASRYVPGNERLLMGVVLLLMLAGAWRCWRDAPHVAAVLVLGSALLVCISDLVAFTWENSLRPVGAMVPLALWALTRDIEPHPVEAQLGTEPTA